MSMLSFSAGGINVAEIVSGLMGAERLPLNNIERRKSAVTLQVTALNSIKTNLADLRTQALALSNTTFSKLTASSSSAAVTASLGAAATTGNISFTVDQVAQAHGVRTAASVATANSPITSDAFLAISSATSALGIGGVRAGAGLGAGNLQVAVTQATAGATRTGTTTLGASTIIGAGNNQISLAIDGVGHTLNLAEGTYTSTELVQAVNDALTAEGAGATASLDATGRLRIATTHEGSAASLQITGGTALASLGLGVDGAAVNGTDGTITIGDETVTVTSARPGEAVSIDTGAGQLDLTLAGGLRVGEAKVAVVSTGDGSVASVASAINSAGVGVGAAAVKMSEGAWILQLSSSTTGTDGTIAIDAAAFTGGLVETAEARDAVITVGTGPGAYSISGRGNTFADVLPGVVLTTSAVSATPVTVGVKRDDAATATAVQSLIEKANVLLAQVSAQTRYDADTRVSGPLSGQSTVRTLADDVRRAITSIVPGATTGLGSSVGISSNREGRLEFDRGAFLTALAEDPEAVGRLFGHGGTGTAGVNFAKASDKTIAGTYAVDITTAATRATTGAVLTGDNPASQQISVRVGDTLVTYDTTPGATAAQIADGLRATLAAAGLQVDAQVDGTDVILKAAKYGTAGTFEFNTTDPGDPGAWTSVAGTDVVGTIDGQAAVGVGNTLKLLDTSTSTARGLEITVNEGVVGPGEITYEPGIAARVAALGTRLTGENGSLTITGNSFEARIKAFNTQIDRFEDRMDRTEARLLRQWSSIQGLLQGLQSQGDWLGNQINAMNRAPSR